MKTTISDTELMLSMPTANRLLTGAFSDFRPVQHHRDIQQITIRKER